jgi:hypothetical protein
MSVPVRLDPSGKNIETGTAVALFLTALRGGEIQTNRQQYAIATDGRILARSGAPLASTTPITLLLNWKPKN